MRRSSCPSVKRARLELGSSSQAIKVEAPKTGDVKLNETSNRLQSPNDEKTEKLDPEKNVRGDLKPSTPCRDKSPALRRKIPQSANEHLKTVRDLESRNDDKLAELKLTLKISERTNHLDLLRRGINDDVDDDGNGGFGDVTARLRGSERESNDAPENDEDDEDLKRERLLEELQSWEEAEKELDEDLARSNKGRNDSHIDKLHEYNDLKDACQAVFGRLAELDQVTVSDIYKRYDVDIND